MGKFFTLSRAFWRKFIEENRSVNIGIPILKLKIPLVMSGIPSPTRTGCDPESREPFYESDLKKLYSWYNNNISNEILNRNLAYVETTYLSKFGYSPIGHDFIDVEKIVVRVSGDRYHVPDVLKRHGRLAVNFFKDLKKLNKDPITGEYENNISLRIRSFGKDGVILAQKAMYFDQVATNLTLDWVSHQIKDSRATIRSEIEAPIDGKLPALSESILANTLGVAVLFLNDDLLPILRIRSDSLASITHKGVHCTVSGVFEVPPDKNIGEFDFSYFTYGVELEILRETGLEPSEYELIPVAFARELPRGGKPQLFFLAVTGVGENDLRERARNAAESYEYIDGDPLEKRISELGDSINEISTYEGAMMLYLATQFVDANDGKLKEVIRTLKAKN